MHVLFQLYYVFIVSNYNQLNVLFQVLLFYQKPEIIYIYIYGHSKVYTDVEKNSLIHWSSHPLGFYHGVKFWYELHIAHEVI